MSYLIPLLSGLFLGGAISGLYFTRRLEEVEHDLANHVHAAHQLARKLGRARKENDELVEQAESLLQQQESRDLADWWKNTEN